jgi:hypothetical protein
MAVILGIAIAITTLLLPLSIYPGLLSELAFLALIGSPFWLPATCISLWVVLDVVHQVPDLLGPPRAQRRRHAIAALVLVLNCGLLWCGGPRRLAFLLARPAFEALLTTAAPAGYGERSLDRRLGAYHVDRLAADARGGVYFRTHSGPDGLYSGTMTYGFSHRPNPAGSPFGDEKYAITHIVGDWYAFQASER